MKKFSPFYAFFYYFYFTDKVDGVLRMQA